MENPAQTTVRRLGRTALVTSMAMLLLNGTAQAQAPPPQSPTAQPAEQETPPPPASGSLFSSMRFRGYTDLGFGSPLQEKLPLPGLGISTVSFQIADFHLFTTAKLSDEWSFLSELLITSDFSNETSAEMDRLMVQYNPSKHLRVGFGKFNAGIGYYSNQFHRAKFYQTTTGRPFMFSDEDNGGILPVHQVGITVQGEIPSGAVGLHYIGEITNGRAFSLTSHEIQNWVDADNFKAVNVGLFVQPDPAPGLEIGFTVYRDTFELESGEKGHESITAAHAVYVTPRFEFLSEMAMVRHDVDAGVSATSKAFYTQVSNRFGIVRPYLRYDYQDVPANDPFFGIGDVAVAFGTRKAVEAGLNFRLHEFAVVKVQFDRALQFGAWANGAHAQLAVAF